MNLYATLFVVFIFISVFMKAQQSNVPLNYQWIQESEAQMVKGRGFPLSASLMKYEADSQLIWALRLMSDSGKQNVNASFPLHSSMRPWIEQGHPIRKNILLLNSTNEHEIFSYQDRFPIDFLNYHSKSSTLQLERKPQNQEPVFRIYLDPLLNVEYMKVLKDEHDATSGMYFFNTRGVTAHGDIGSKISFETTFYENQAVVPRYLKDFANATLVMPGQGRWKAYKVTGYDYAMSSGYLSYSPSSFFNMQIGSGKHFVGDGYRSLLLSDNSFSYPFARLTGWFGPNKMFQYSTIYASLMNLVTNTIIPSGTERLYQKKAASFTQLSANIGRTAEISLFQGLIWSAADERNKQCITLAYLNPVMFTSLPFFGLNEKHNYLLGATFRWDLFKTLRLYGQLVADDFGAKGAVSNKNGFQLGVKYYNAFNVKHLHLQLEYNRVNPYTYAARDSAQAYTHYNQALAHPLGANFSELTGSLQYKYGDFYVHVRISSAMIGADTAGNNFGQNVFLSDANAYFTNVGGTNKIGQGQKTTLNYFDASVGYMISYASNLNVAIGFTNRNVDAGGTRASTQFVYLALRTSLTNTYFDFFRK